MHVQRYVQPLCVFIKSVMASSQMPGSRSRDFRSCACHTCTNNVRHAGTGVRFPRNKELCKRWLNIVCPGSTARTVEDTLSSQVRLHISHFADGMLQFDSDGNVTRRKGIEVLPLSDGVFRAALKETERKAAEEKKQKNNARRAAKDARRLQAAARNKKKMEATEQKKEPKKKKRTTTNANLPSDDVTHTTTPKRRRVGNEQPETARLPRKPTDMDFRSQTAALAPIAMDAAKQFRVPFAKTIGIVKLVHTSVARGDGGLAQTASGVCISDGAGAVDDDDSPDVADSDADMFSFTNSVTDEDGVSVADGRFAVPYTWGHNSFGDSHIYRLIQSDPGKCNLYLHWPDYTSFCLFVRLLNANGELDRIIPYRPARRDSKDRDGVDLAMEADSPSGLYRGFEHCDPDECVLLTLVILATGYEFEEAADHFFLPNAEYVSRIYTTYLSYLDEFFESEFPVPTKQQLIDSTPEHLYTAFGINRDLGEYLQFIGDMFGRNSWKPSDPAAERALFDKYRAHCGVKMGGFMTGIGYCPYRWQTGALCGSISDTQAAVSTRIVQDAVEGACGSYDKVTYTLQQCTSQFRLPCS